MVWLNFNQTSNVMQSAMNNLGSGLRINFAGDDPAGLALSERMRSQIRNSNMAAQNIQNEMAYMRTADSWMQVINNMLHRMSELSVAANDGTKSPADLSNLQTEFEQLQTEITQITTGDLARGKYNTLNLFDGSTHNVQVGPDPGQWFTSAPIDLRANNTKTIGTAHNNFNANGAPIGAPANISWSSILASPANGGISINSPAAAARAGSYLNTALNHIGSQRAVLGSQFSRLSNSLEGLRTYETNIRGAESQIRNADIAWEATRFTQNQILNQLGGAMLAQAHALPRNVLQLLG